MTLSANSLISGATALSFEDLAEVQAAMAQMEEDNLQMFIGTDGKSGFFEVEGMSNQAALAFANEQALKQMQQGWVQGANSAVQALGTLGAVVGGEFAASEDDTTAANLKKELNPPSAIKANAELVQLPKANEQEMVELKGAPSAPVNPPEVSEESTTVTGRLAERTTDEARQAVQDTEKADADKAEKNKQMDNALTRASNARNRYQHYGQMFGNFGSSACGVAGGYLKQAETNATGSAQFMQGTQQMFNQVTQATTAAIGAELNQENAAAGAFSGIVALTGQARG